MVAAYVLGPRRIRRRAQAVEPRAVEGIRLDRRGGGAGGRWPDDAARDAVARALVRRLPELPPDMPDGESVNYLAMLGSDLRRVWWGTWGDPRGFVPRIAITISPTAGRKSGC